MSEHVGERDLKETFIAEIGRPGVPAVHVAAFVHVERGAVANVQLTFSDASGNTMADVVMSPDDVGAVLGVLGSACARLDRR